MVRGLRLRLRHWSVSQITGRLSNMSLINALGLWSQVIVVMVSDEPKDVKWISKSATLTTKLR